MKNKYVVGIDIGKNENVAHLRDFRSSHARFVFANNPQGYTELIAQVADTPVTFGLEATGFYHLPLAFWLKERDYPVRIINPLLTKKMAKASIRKTKTDTVDSSHISLITQMGEGYPFDESRLVLQLKVLCRHRIFLKRQIARLRKHHESITFRNTILIDELMNFLPEAASSCAALIAAVEKEIETIEERILELGKKIPEIDYLDSIPGISRLLACQLFSELGNIERFTQPKSLVAFAGIDPSICQSGTLLHTSGTLSKRGSPYLRYYLFLAARAAIRPDPELKMYYQKKKHEGKHYYIRLAAISRKLLMCIYRVLKDKRMYVRAQMPVENL